jgi:predicted transcriptional regulator
MERISREFFVLSKLHEAGAVDEERAMEIDKVKKIVEINPDELEKILEFLESKKYIAKKENEKLRKVYVTRLGIIMASSLYT